LPIGTGIGLGLSLGLDISLAWESAPRIPVDPSGMPSVRRISSRIWRLALEMGTRPRSRLATSSWAQL
jgi:hypothetical protein